MAYKEIRINQLITPFGPGGLHIDKQGTPHVLCGLDHWFESQQFHTSGSDDYTNQQLNEFEIFEPRLSELLQVARFRRPPDYRIPRRRAATQPPNSLLPVPAHRFPTWYSSTKTGEMKKFELSTRRMDPPEKGGRWQPVRFAAVCANGCLTDFPWQQWIACTCGDFPQLRMHDSGGTELSGIEVSCKGCEKQRSLRGITEKSTEDSPSALQNAGITCPGERAWLGKGAEITCDQSLVGVLINQTNLHMANVVSAIHIPNTNDDDETLKLIQTLKNNADGNLGIAKTMWLMGSDNHNLTITFIETALTSLGIEASREVIRKALESLCENSTYMPSGALPPAEPEPPQQKIRREEFSVIREHFDRPNEVPDLCVISGTIPDSLQGWLSRLNRVESLRETRVYCGFSRLEPKRSLDTMPESAMIQLFRHPPREARERWLPAVETFGEGLYLELNEEKITEWQTDNAEWIKSRISPDYLNTILEQDLLLPPLNGDMDRNIKWASRYLLTHTLAHALITQMTFETGYGTASMRERLYISADPNSPMAGILIYTAAGDSEGTLGGLVRLGYPEMIEAVFLNALNRISWCSADPVCAEQKEGVGSRGTNLAACNACVMLPETSCETFNNGLDRAMIIGTPEERKCGFMSELVDKAFEYGNQ